MQTESRYRFNVTKLADRNFCAHLCSRAAIRKYTLYVQRCHVAVFHGPFECCVNGGPLYKFLLETGNLGTDETRLPAIYRCTGYRCLRSSFVASRREQKASDGTHRSLLSFFVPTFSSFFNPLRTTLDFCFISCFSRALPASRITFPSSSDHWFLSISVSVLTGFVVLLGPSVSSCLALCVTFFFWLRGIRRFGFSLFHFFYAFSSGF